MKRIPNGLHLRAGDSKTKNHLTTRFPEPDPGAGDANHHAQLVSEVKIGLEAITSGFADTLAVVAHELGIQIGWDGKWADISETVGRSRGPRQKRHHQVVQRPRISGPPSVEAAVQACHALGLVKVYGVTVLTGIDADECKSNFGDEPGPKVLQLQALPFWLLLIGFFRKIFFKIKIIYFVNS